MIFSGAISITSMINVQYEFLNSNRIVEKGFYSENDAAECTTQMLQGVKVGFLRQFQTITVSSQSDIRININKSIICTG